MSHNQQQQNCCWGEVILLDGRSVEILIQPRLFAGDLFDTVASHFDLKEKEYFGLAFLDETGQYNWLNLEKRVLEHEYAQYTSNHIRQQSPTPFSIQSNQQSTKITNKNNNDNQQTQKHCSTLNEIKSTKFRLTKSKSRLPNVGKLKSLKKNKNLKHLTKTTTTTTTQPLSSMSSSINVDNKSRHSIPNHHYDHLINTNSSSMTTIKSANSTNALSVCISGSSYFIESITMLQDVNTIELFYLQAKSLLTNVSFNNAH
ncbi:FERM domain-containing protein 4A, partial [Dermatophagoides pteronyssinus]